MNGLSTGWSGEMIYSNFDGEFFSSCIQHSHPKRKRNETIANIMLQTITRMGRKEIKTKLIKKHTMKYSTIFFSRFLPNELARLVLGIHELEHIYLCSLGIQIVSNSQ